MTSEKRQTTMNFKFWVLAAPKKVPPGGTVFVPGQAIFLHIFLIKKP